MTETAERYLEQERDDAEHALKFERVASRVIATQRDSAYECLEATLLAIAETLPNLPTVQRDGLLALRERIQNTLPVPTPSEACA